MRCSTGSRSSSRRCATPRRRTQADARTGNVEFAQPARAPAVGEPMLLDGKRLLITGVLTDDSIAYAVAERAQRAGAVVGLDFDATRAWPAYDWMGVAKAALEAVNRYLARDLGARSVRANLVAAGPLATMAARGIDGFDTLAGAWQRQAPLGWDIH